jgi:hypothetical protein
VLDVNIDHYDAFPLETSLQEDLSEKLRRRNLRKMLFENKSLLYSPNEQQTPVEQ